MSPGPLRRFAGALGLVALAPIAWLLATGSITLVDAAVRAAATLALVVVLGRGAGVVVAGLAGFVERSAADESGPTGNRPGELGTSAPRS